MYPNNDSVTAEAQHREIKSQKQVQLIHVIEKHKKTAVLYHLF